MVVSLYPFISLHVPQPALFKASLFHSDKAGPGSFLEVSKILEGLTNPPDGSTAFHVVAPSLPNFGFSQGVNKRGFALAQYAETLQKMMLGLGYEQYVTQAGDWGYWITRAMGKLYPQSVKASLMNMPFASPPTWKSPLARIQAMMPYDEGDRTGVQRRGRFKREGRGYNEVQSTRPQTLAYALASSPVALLAWMYEKLHDWTDAYPWSNDEIITWVSIYWFSEAGPGAAARIYYETAHTERGTTGCTYEELQEWIGGVKLGLVFNPRELEPVPKSWGATLGEVIYQVENPGGGHFYAHEEPELLLRDLREMFRKGGGAFGVVKGADGC